MKKSYLVLIPIILNLIFTQSVIIKDSELSPNTLLEINDEGEHGSITIPSGRAPSIISNKLYNDSGTLKWDGGTLTTGNPLWTLNSGNVYRSSGNVGIGTSNPLSKLSVGGNGDSEATIYGESFGNVGVKGVATSTDGTNSGGRFISYGYSGRGVYGWAINSTGSGLNINYGGYFQSEGPFGIGVNGYATGSGGIGVYGNGVSSDFWAHNGTYGNTSSIRWKRNIIEIDNPLVKLSEIRGVYFDWDEEHGGEHSVGFIAEEVGKVLPEIVFYEENGKDAKGMDYSKITPLLVEAVKELSKEVDRLKQLIGE